jgi:hypothetical protein
MLQESTREIAMEHFRSQLASQGRASWTYWWLWNGRFQAIGG